jgi:hypothetical protein
MFDDYRIQGEVLANTHSERHDAKLRAAYHQRMPRTSDGGRRILFVCPYCQRLWLKDGRHKALVRLTDKQEWLLVRELREGYHGETLAASLCRLCAAQLGGNCNVEAIYHSSNASAEGLTPCGYRFSWEGIPPVAAHLLCVIARVPGREVAMVDTLLNDVLAMRLDCSISHNVERELMAWVKCLSVPVNATPYSQSVKLAQSRLDPPVHGRDAIDREWCGHSWITDCPPLGGASVVSLALALPPHVACLPDVTLKCWSSLVSIFEAVLS